MQLKDTISMGLVIALVGVLCWMRATRSGETGAFPQRAITIICPYPPGGGTDLFCRGLARVAESRLGRTVTVTNQTGGGGAVGFAAGLLAAADGHTLTALTFELVSLPPQGLVPFTHEDFELLLRVNMDPSVLTVRADFPGNTVEDFVAVARGRAGQLRIGTSGPASVWHLAALQFARAAGFEARLVPFGGAASAVTALVGGHIDAVTVGSGEVMSQVRSGQLKILAAMSDTRLASWPEVPTCRERGIDVVFGTWRGLGIPRGTPGPVRDTLARVFDEAAHSAEFAEFAGKVGLNLAVANAAEFRRAVAAQAVEVEAMMKQMGEAP